MFNQSYVSLALSIAYSKNKKFNNPLLDGLKKGTTLNTGHKLVKKKAKSINVYKKGSKVYGYLNEDLHLPSLNNASSSPKKSLLATLEEKERHNNILDTEKFIEDLAKDQNIDLSKSKIIFNGVEYKQSELNNIDYKDLKKINITINKSKNKTENDIIILETKNENLKPFEWSNSLEK